MYFVYVLQSIVNKKFYIGFSSDPWKRLQQHNEGLTISTKANIPYQLIYIEGFKSKTDALVREKKLKHHGQGIRRLKERLKHSAR